MENKTTDRILVMDINYLLPEYKDMKSEEIERIFEKKYNCKILFTDSSRVNTQGAINHPYIKIL